MPFGNGCTARVRTDLQDWEYYGGVCFIPSMGELRGDLVHVTRACGDVEEPSGMRYYVEEDLDGWTWSEEMFELSGEDEEEIQDGGLPVSYFFK